MPSASRFWIAPASVMVAGALAGVAAGSIAAANHGEDVRLAPTPAGWLLSASFGLPIVVGVIGLVWLLVRWRRARPSTSVRSRVLVAVVIALGLLGVAAGGFAIDLQSSLFDGVPDAESRSPGGRRAYAIPTAFFCGHELWVQAAGALTMHRIDRADTRCETTPGIAWDGEVPRFTGVVPGEPMNLYFGPH
jgi:hypothetical protein